MAEIQTSWQRFKMAKEIKKYNDNFRDKPIWVIEKLVLLDNIIQFYEDRENDVNNNSQGSDDQSGQSGNEETYSSTICILKQVKKIAISAIHSGNYKSYKKVSKAIRKRDLVATANSGKALADLSDWAMSMLEEISNAADKAMEIQKNMQYEISAIEAHRANKRKVNEWLSHERHNGSKQKKWSQKMQREEQEYAQKIISALDELDDIVRNLQNFAVQHNSYIDEAAISGDNARAEQLIKQKLRVCGFIDRIKKYKSNIMMSANMKQMISQIGKLPKIIDTCKSLLLNQQEYFKVRKTIASISQDIDKSDEELAKLNGLLDPQSAENGFGGFDDAADGEKSEQFKAEWEASVQRVKGKIAPETVAKAGDVGANAAGEIDYADIVAKENQRK